MNASPAIAPLGGARRARRDRWILLGLAGFWCLVALLSLYAGALDTTAAEVVRALHDPDGVSPAVAAVVRQIRVPRLILGTLAGAGLAVAGAALQGLIRNPLADPQLIGVSAGAALGAVLAIAGGLTTLPGLSGLSGTMAIAVCAFVGALSVSILTLRLATRGGRTSVVTLLLAGIAINAGAFAVIGYFNYAADDEQLRNITLWTLGSLAGGTTEINAIAFVAVALGVGILMRDARALDLMLVGESEAFHMGVDVQSLKRRVVCVSAGMVGAVVAFSGLIGFVGLVVPHMVRLTAGPRHGLLIPASALLGAGLLVMADVGARTVVAPSELPIGVLTAAVGAPFFLALLLGAHKRGVGL